MNISITGAEILLRSLSNHGVDTIFGYPGSCVMAVLDCLYTYDGSMKHILVRHEQGAIHAAQGYAKVSGKVGVSLLTSGPGATNAVTGIADAMANSTPLVVITGQVHSSLLGTDAFQEVDIIGITHSITKWTYQIRSVHDISSAVAHAFYIASTGRPGPVLLDITKDAQTEAAVYMPQRVDFIRSYNPVVYVPQQVDLEVGHISGEKNDMISQIANTLESLKSDTILVLDTKYDRQFQLASNEVVRSEKFGTAGFGLPAAIGAKCAAPAQTVCLIVDTDKFQTTIQELGVIMQLGIDIKIFLLNDDDIRSGISNPDFMLLTDAYNIQKSTVSKSRQLSNTLLEALNSEGAYLLEIKTEMSYCSNPSVLA